MYIENCTGKSPIVKKKNYAFQIKFSYLKRVVNLPLVPGFPEMLVMGFATPAARKVVHLEFERERERPLNLSTRSNFKWTNQC